MGIFCELTQYTVRNVLCAVYSVSHIIFCKQNPEEEEIINLSTSSVKCSHCTLRNSQW